MAILKTGQVGTFNGKVGQVVVTTWKDLLVGKDTPTKSKKPGSDEQKVQRAQFRLVAKLFRGMGDIIALGYQHEATGVTTAINAAVQYHLENAITGEYPNYKLDYTKLVLSNAKMLGEIDGSGGVTVLPEAGNLVKVSWELFKNASSTNVSSPEDRLSFIFYSETKDRFIVYQRVVARSAMTYEVEIPYPFKGDNCHGYMFFSSVKGKHVSVSEYLGKFKVI